MTFKELNLIEPLLRAIENEGYTEPTPIQQKAIPLVLSGSDLIGVAQTGTGKTAAFSLPILQWLSEHPRPAVKGRLPRALILAPTRELAIQIEENLNIYGKFTELKSIVVYGGVGITPQIEAVRRGVDILVATPGRLLDLIGQRVISLQQLDIFVLDEADRMLDMGFIHDIRKVLSHLPSKRQNLLFSATFSPEVKSVADQFLRSPQQVEVERRPESVGAIEEWVFLVEKNDKPELLQYLINDLRIKKGIVFTRTKHGADKLAKVLARNGISAGAIHGNKSQSARQAALADFRDGRMRILVASDIAARGIDIDDITHVFNFEIPEVPETYVHRIGRTARASARGMAIAFCSADERKYFLDVQKLTGRLVPVADTNPYPSMELTEEMLQMPAPKSAPAKKSSPPPARPSEHRREGGQGTSRSGSSSQAGGQKKKWSGRPKQRP
jgi:ATP-dependent RNA helicase RhlE